ncbi:UNVERIFIED_ORG: type I site-specific restriction-modification system R (restriction) subunit [Heyndrickxia coagulans]
MDVYEVFEELIKFKEELEEAIEEGEQLGLTYEEKAFFDVLGADPDIKKLMEDDILIKIAKDLTKAVKENRTVDWDKKGKPKPKCALPLKKFCANTDTRQTRNQRLWRMCWNRRSCRLRICNGPDLSEKS